MAVVALGSYARRQLCPASDIDLLLLHDGWAHRDLEELVRSLCYPLWDAGLSVGHAVRTGREAVRAASDRVDTATALTDRRLVAGDPGLVDDLAARLRRWMRPRSARVLGDLADADSRRHAAAGMHPGMLEPELKEGAGGLRDLHSLRWAAACVLGEVGLDPLVGARYLGATDRRDLAAAGDTLLAARCALHLARGATSDRAGAGIDRLRLDLQDEVADLLGWGDADDLARRVGLATRTVSHVYGRTWPLLVADARAGRRRRRSAGEQIDEGVALVGGLVEVDTNQSLTVDPALGMRAVAAAAGRGVHLGRATSERLRRQVEQQPRLRWDADSREALLTALRAGPDGVAALEDADHLGLLTAHLPDWARVRGRPQRNALHRYDLDTHCLQAVAELVLIARGSLGERHKQMWEGLADPDTLLLATWLHDIGKAWPGDHSVAGAQVAREWVLRMGFSQRRADRVYRFVRLHLLMPEVATRRDLDDEDELVAVAEQVGDAETLDGLYLLSLADARATGPAANSPWKDMLLAELHGRVRRLLTTDDEHRSAPAGPDAVVAQARSLLRDDPTLDALLAGLPRRYLHAASPEQVVEHARLLRSPLAAGQLRARPRGGPVDGTAILSVVAADRRGLMADCAGVLAGAGLAVLDARAFTRTDGVALDWFVVRTPEDPDWAAVEEALRDAVSGTLDVAGYVGRRESLRRSRAPAGETVPVEVRFDRRPMATRIEVHGPDSTGMLYRLARVLADEDLDVIGARVATVGEAAHDVFFVRPVGGPIDTTALGSLLRDATSPTAANEPPSRS